MSEVDELIAVGDRILADPELAGSPWLRAAGVLYRSALEETLGTFWRRHAPGVHTANWRAQLACLTVYVDPELAREASNAWGALSQVTHHRSALGPDRGEVLRLGQTVRRLIGELSVGPVPKGTER